MKIAVVGAGPAGLSCALSLAREGAETVVFEASSQPGGLCRSFDLWDMRVDLGPHRFFSMDKKVTDFWMAPVADEYVLVERLTRIFYKNKFFNYPIKPLDALSKLGIGESLHCVASYAAAQFETRKEDKTFSEWVSRRFGKRLYEIFFKSYSEKLWGIPCDELDASFAAQRIKGLNFYETVKNALFSGKTKHKTLVEQFAYPKMGAGQPYEKMAEELVRLGGKIFYNAPVQGLTADSNRISGIMSRGGVIPVDFVVTTMPFTDVVENCPAIGEEARNAAKKLGYRNTIIVYLLVDQEKIFHDNWIYVHAANLKTGRICNFRNWSPDMVRGSKKSILALEYWANDDDELWLREDRFLENLAKREIAQTGLVPAESVMDAHVERLHRSYPVYANGYEAEVAKMQKAVDAIPNLCCIGRNGAFKYNNQDHSILMGLLAAENILGKAAHDLWRINTDYDYQEGAGDALVSGNEQ